MNTFRHLETWLREINNEASQNALVYLVANKSDMESAREVSRSDCEDFAKANNLNGFFETSAKSGQNVENAFMTAARELFK